MPRDIYGILLQMQRFFTQATMQHILEWSAYPLHILELLAVPWEQNYSINQQKIYTGTWLANASIIYNQLP